MRRMTKQKKMLQEGIRKFSSFFDAHDLYGIMKKDRKLGLATIYRFLNALEQDGAIHSFICGNRKIYSNTQKSHVHFNCERCNTIKHLEIKNVDFLKELSNDEVCHFQIEMTGLCSGCKAAAEKKERV